MFRAVRVALEAGAERFGFRLVHFSVLRNHLHLIAEADDEVALARRKHEAQRGRRLAPGFIDPCSSAAAFDGWRERDAEPSMLARAVGWILRKGWRKRGLLSVAAVPGEGLPRSACLRECSRDLGALGRGLTCPSTSANRT